MDYKKKHITKISEVRKVDIITLDEFCSKNKIDEVSILKIDTEGGELDVLTGFKRFLSSKKVKMIIFEHAPVLTGYDRESRLEVFKYLNSFGYVVHNLDHRIVDEDTMSVVSQGDFYATIP